MVILNTNIIVTSGVILFLKIMEELVENTLLSDGILRMLRSSVKVIVFYCSFSKLFGGCKQSTRLVFWCKPSFLLHKFPHCGAGLQMASKG